ncbi:rRNA maturation RNase YbeY [Rubritalea tangerina]|uniref:Endoribonuclease YbeY n=1 Tax=Rubritalea tangerina TaxID=430798 RepID=A0ABW4Z7A5_9BACT
MVEVYNNQEVKELPASLMEKWEAAANAALPMALAHPANGGGVLAGLDFVEVSLVDDATIDQVHRDFMDIPGATDVITFAHGEIVISVETAQAYGEQYGNSFEHELMLYIIHGLLHLSGHEDAEAGEREAMEEIQARILEEVWC